MKIYLVALSLFFLGCGHNATTDGDVTSQGTYQANCQISDSQANPIACIDYPQDSGTQNFDCMNNERSAFSAEGAASTVYIAITTAGASTSCAITFPASHLFGSCKVGSGAAILRYYFNSGAMPADCSNRGGTFVPNME